MWFICPQLEEEFLFVEFIGQRALTGVIMISPTTDVTTIKVNREFAEVLQVLTPSMSQTSGRINFSGDCGLIARSILIS